MKTLTLTLIMFSTLTFAQELQISQNLSSNSVSKKNIEESLIKLTESSTMDDGVFILKVKDLDLVGLRDGQIVFLDVQNKYQGFYFWDEQNYRWNKIINISKRK